MSTFYYIADKNKMKEYMEFRQFWEEKAYPEFVKMVNGYAESVDGQIINKYTFEDDKEGFPTRYVPLDEETYKEELGQYSYMCKRFDFEVFSYSSLAKYYICNKESLKKYLNEHPESIILSETDQEYSYEEFIKEVNL